MARDHIFERGRNTKIYYPRICLGLYKQKKRSVLGSKQQIKCVKLTFVCNVLCMVLWARARDIEHKHAYG